MSEKNRILVVEDNDFVRMQVVRFLGDAGFEVVECADAVAAMEKIADNIDVAIVDIRMEPMDGFEFIKSLRGKDIEVPVILVTGDQNPDLLNEAGRWGVSAVLMKPVERDRLVKMVTRTIQNIARAS
jgi:CheY-like chemotaxis protein